jgi:glucose-1-phosphate thymidylyltransferase
MKNAIILSGGHGTRLAPLTHVVNKQLLGVNGKFVIDYPINTLKQMGVENCTVVLGSTHFSQVVDHLQDGRNHGMNFNYVFQGEPKGIAHAVNLCHRFVKDD